MNPRPHVIFTNGRSGSNYVSNLLNAHPLVTNYGEVMGESSPAFRLQKRWNTWGDSTEEYLDTVLESRAYFEMAQAYSAVQHLRRREQPNHKRWSTTQSVGFKEFGIRFERRGLDEYLADRPDIRVISLVRENTFDRVVSVNRLGQTHEVLATDSDSRSSDAPIRIPVERFLSDLAVFEDEKLYQLEIVNALSTDRVLHVTYEELFVSEASQVQYRARLFDLLEVSDADVSSSHRKLSNKPVSERISNYEEIHQAVAATRFACYLP